MAIIFENNKSYTPLDVHFCFTFTTDCKNSSGLCTLQFLQLVVCYFSCTDNTTGPTIYVTIVLSSSVPTLS